MKISPNTRKFRLSLKSNGLVGEGPKRISTQTGLYFLDLSKNKLQSAFPQWFLEIRSLEVLILSDNEFAGSLLDNDLQVLALLTNYFSGELPKHMGDHESSLLIILTLSHNKFSGHVPQSLINGPYLRLLDLSRNRFSGHFPIFYPEVQLANIDFSDNDFSG